MPDPETLFGYPITQDGSVPWWPAMVLTLLDALLTYLWLATGMAREGNPWLAELVHLAGPGVAMTARAAVGLALVTFLAILAGRLRIAGRGLVLVTAVLGLVLGWHIGGSVLVAFV